MREDVSSTVKLEPTRVGGVGVSHTRQRLAGWDAVNRNGDIDEREVEARHINGMS